MAFLYRIPVYLHTLKAQSKGTIGFGRDFYSIQAANNEDAFKRLRAMVSPGDLRPLDGEHLIKKYRSTIPLTYRPWLKRLLHVFEKLPAKDTFIKEVYSKVESDGYFKVTIDLISYRKGVYLKLVGQPTYPGGMREGNLIVGIMIQAMGTFIANGEICPISLVTFGDLLALRRNDIKREKVSEYIQFVLSKIADRQQSVVGLKKVPVLGFNMAPTKRRRICDFLKQKKFYVLEMEGLVEETRCLMSANGDVVRWGNKKLKLKRAPKSLRKFFNCPELYIGIV